MEALSAATNSTPMLLGPAGVHSQLAYDFDPTRTAAVVPGDRLVPVAATTATLPKVTSPSIGRSPSGDDGARGVWQLATSKAANVEIKILI